MVLQINVVSVVDDEIFFNLIQDGGGGRRLGVGQKRPRTRFSHVPSTNVGLSLQVFVTFSFNTFVV